MGWNYPTFEPSALPDKKFLDEVVPDRPVYLRAFDGHSSWANSKALAMAGIKREHARSSQRQDRSRRQRRGHGSASRNAADDLVAEA